MAKKRQRFSGAITKEEAKEISQGVIKEKTQPQKSDSKKRNHKVLYVSPEHHQKAKTRAYLQGFQKLRDYIEYLIDQEDNKKV